jgi:hypothetical protein
MNIRWLIENIIWTLIFLISCFSAGYIIRPRFDTWKKNNNKNKDCSNIISGDNKNEKLV